MPTYDFINKDTGEVFEDMMSISACESYLTENPHIERYFGGKSINFIDEIALGRKQPPREWFHVLDKIKKNNPHHNMHNSRFHRSREW